MVEAIERSNLRRFCMVAGIDFDIAAQRNGNGTSSYCFESGGREWSGEPPVFWIQSAGRFGNNIQQIIHATHVAESIGVNRIYIQEVNVGMLRSNWRLADISFSPFAPWPGGPVFSGTFFYRDCFRRLFSRFDGQKLLCIVARVIAPMLRRRWPAVKTSAEDVLHIHIRSGDIFAPGGSHWAYVQPPLAFYRQVLRHFARAHGSPKVVLVFEDRCNPCVDALCDFLESWGVSYAEECSTFEQAVEELLSARNLVMGFGTFAPMIGLVSSHLRRIYSFRSVISVQSFAAKGTEVLVGHDAGDYTAPDSWQNSLEQLRRMIEYPDECLRIA
jgi:hypothetical protein